jgi:hypothetical protein
MKNRNRKEWKQVADGGREWEGGGWEQLEPEERRATDAAKKKQHWEME